METNSLEDYNEVVECGLKGIIRFELAKLKYTSKVRTLADMDDAERAAIEKLYGARIVERVKISFEEAVMKECGWIKIPHWSKTRNLKSFRLNVVRYFKDEKFRDSLTDCYNTGNADKLIGWIKRLARYWPKGWEIIGFWPKYETGFFTLEVLVEGVEFTPVDETRPIPTGILVVNNKEEKCYLREDPTLSK